VSAPLQAFVFFLPICLMYYYSLQIKMGLKINVYYTRKSSRLETTQGSQQSRMLGSSRDSVTVWTAISWWSIGAIIIRND
jgi:hypothetical protein